MRYLLLSLLLLGINYLYSAYSIDVSKEYARKVSELKKEKERSLILKAELERHVNYRTAKVYAESAGFGPIDWSRVRLVKVAR
ncbi:MAG: hypothetical protein N2648_01040 [Aquificaceae bacterium]|nr:hypothetical protein [Aquificaceae bacterium]MCS7196963.1 hypothetical protein [Aquificaceae bacterium]MCX7989213.1 hypothetical protein [Aquificaceae bacterium]MDW8031922.1 hypothetical protein [Aquificaceae bacterium]MDW8294830.1 hypothetical protein [Aquificaceae bacterium]